MKFVLALCFLFIIGSSFGQVKTRLYYNEYWWLQASNSNSVKYYRKCTVDTVNGGFIGSVKDYQKDPKRWVLIMEGNFGTTTEYNHVKHRYDGAFVYYFDTGKKKYEANFVNGKKSGVWKIYYRNGNLRTKVAWSDTKGLTILEHYDRDGKQVEKKYLMPHETPNEYAKEMYEDTADHLDSALMTEFPFLKKFEDNSYQRDLEKDLVKYPTDDSPASLLDNRYDFDVAFPGGIDNYLKMLRDKIVYPQQAFKDKIEGLVIVNVFIDNDGSIEKAKVIKDIGGGCGEEAVRLVLEGPKFTPARRAGKRIKRSILLPVQFELP